jgi:heme ABC exporter ATP-binding subunit CcmA
MVRADPPAVRCRGLARQFRTLWAVRDITFVLPPYSVLLIVGPNGSGKTTLLRLLATALRPTYGEAIVLGHDLVHEADAVRSLSAFVGTAPGVYDVLTARENLQFAAAMCGRPREPALPWLERVGLAGAADQPVRTFSQGMKRRLALARAWLASPRLLLLDEPYSGLDSEGLGLITKMTSDTTHRGGSVIIATHEWERGVKVADTVLALAAGRPVEVGPTAHLTPAEMAAAAGGKR